MKLLAPDLLTNELKSLSIEAAKQLLENKTLIAGELDDTGKFLAWEYSTQKTISKIESEWEIWVEGPRSTLWFDLPSPRF